VNKLGAVGTIACCAVTLGSGAMSHPKPESGDGFFVLSDQARLYYRTLGTGPVLHGGPGANMHGLYDNFSPLAAGRPFDGRVVWAMGYFGPDELLLNSETTSYDASEPRLVQREGAGPVSRSAP
jgi:hypothetical protein